MTGGHDHQPIGKGRVDFKMVRSFWQPHHLLVLELNPRVSADDVLASRNGSRICWGEADRPTADFKRGSFRSQESKKGSSLFHGF